MPIVRPFRAIRPTADKAHLVVTRSYISYGHEALSQKLDSNPYSFVHVINPDHGQEGGAAHGSQEFFEKVREKYLDFYYKGYFVREETPVFYLYEQSSEQHRFMGIICATASLDYAEGRIKKHEQTLVKREKMFTEYLGATGINAEPVLLSYPDDEAIQSVMERNSAKPPIYDFSTTDMFRHKLWAIDSLEDMQRIEQRFAQMEAFYIADGHHRSASSARLSEQKNGGEYGLNAAHDLFMSYLVPASSMHIEAFHRVLQLEGEVDKMQVLDKLGEHFEVEHLDHPQSPRQHAEMCILFHGDCYRLQPKQDCPEKLDVELCSELILSPIFGIEDLRNDKRISFLSGNKGMKGVQEELEKEENDVMILLYPIQMEEVFRVSDQGESMPPKSTWVEPKLRSALTIYSLTEH